ncbi:MAG: hypothetical protein U0822_08605 [Anaerolineae bacterium]
MSTIRMSAPRWTRSRVIALVLLFAIFGLAVAVVGAIRTGAYQAAAVVAPEGSPALVAPGSAGAPLQPGVSDRWYSEAQPPPAAVSDYQSDRAYFAARGTSALTAPAPARSTTAHELVEMEASGQVTLARPAAVSSASMSAGARDAAAMGVASYLAVHGSVPAGVPFAVPSNRAGADDRASMPSYILSVDPQQRTRQAATEPSARGMQRYLLAHEAAADARGR